MSKELQAVTEAYSSTTAGLLTSANLAQNPMLSAALSSEMVANARQYGTLRHFETNHKYDGQPYDVHLKMVFDYACKYAYMLPDEEAVMWCLAASWTHDVIEDCRQTYNDVREALGGAVAGITYALSNEKGKNRKERANDKYYEGIRNFPFAIFVKLCDRLANVKYSKDSKSKMIEVYKKEHTEFIESLIPAGSDKRIYQKMISELEWLVVWPPVEYST